MFTLCAIKRSVAGSLVFVTSTDTIALLSHTSTTAPWLTKLANAFLSGRLEERQAELARDAVNNLEQLGPTYIKLGQILSIR
jgi:predicted unusual protein kinase regulating ubiquinone biosynthesis (AarF/ABC1/UbiB family)